MKSSFFKLDEFVKLMKEEEDLPLTPQECKELLELPDLNRAIGVLSMRIMLARTIDEVMKEAACTAASLFLTGYALCRQNRLAELMKDKE